MPDCSAVDKPHLCQHVTGQVVAWSPHAGSPPHVLSLQVWGQEDDNMDLLERLLHKGHGQGHEGHDHEGAGPWHDGAYFKWYTRAARQKKRRGHACKVGKGDSFRVGRCMHMKGQVRDGKRLL